MDKLSVKASILRTVEQEIETWLEEEGEITDAFVYEQRLFERAMRIGKSMLEGSQEKLSRDRNLKKSLDDIWQG